MKTYLFVKHASGEVDEYPVAADSVLSVDGSAFSLSGVEKVWVAGVQPLDEPAEGVEGGIGQEPAAAPAEAPAQ